MAGEDPRRGVPISCTGQLVRNPVNAETGTTALWRLQHLKLQAGPLGLKVKPEGMCTLRLVLALERP
jgi:hypothetical protein